ncbi:MarR family winged helix-turn-helix transcriptional regulator [Antrihabitans cavernicola]|uniref:MarR family transcriptional regulator n=1 Tax=Antrihabitans cavernicola TaxID=2495913 RepID=A0A5A7S5W8_9NOCA|nr:MarR family transcriptional regulator [Spelaeibacter cavernicola]KAA0018455.1 MarR family transcriptional regulator [Spelaeibacter cavernicola]
MPRPDLAAMLLQLGRATAIAEEPILRDHDLTMWAYVVLLHLDDQPVRTQAALAEAIGADKTRIIDVLDNLQHRGLIAREPDPADRRARLLSITPTGQKLRNSAQTAIQANEQSLLGTLTAADQRKFLATLQRLADEIS